MQKLKANEHQQILWSIHPIWGFRILQQMDETAIVCPTGHHLNITSPYQSRSPVIWRSHFWRLWTNSLMISPFRVQCNAFRTPLSSMFSRWGAGCKSPMSFAACVGCSTRLEGGFLHQRYCRARDHSRAIGKNCGFHLQDGWQMVRNVRRTAWDKAAVWDVQLVSCESLDHQTSHRSLALLMVWQEQMPMG